MHKIKAQQLAYEITKIAKSRPDYRYTDEYEESLYFDPETKEPMCIVGLALSNFGFDLDDIVMQGTGLEPKQNEFGYCCGQVLDDAYDNWSVVKWIGDVQESQDLGGTWQTAIIDADNKMKGLTNIEEDSRLH